MSVRGNLCSGKSHSENCRRGNISPGNCPFGELPFEKMSIGKMSSGNCPLGKSPSGKCPSGNCPRTIYLFIYLIIYLFMKYWKYSLWSIMKNQKLPFTSIEKIAAEFFFFFKIHRKTPDQQYHFNKISYLKLAILLKQETLTQMFYSVIFEIFQDSHLY